MSRLFLSPREIDFINDLTKEVIKDVVGQKIFYYAVQVKATKIHDVYEEAMNKVFAQPIEIDARVDYQPEENRVNRFGVEDFYTIDVYLHYRDLLDKNIDVQQGDYFSYGTTFFEIVQMTYDTTIYGQIEHSMGIKIVGKQAREGQISKTPNGPTDEQYTDKGAVQETFAQQRGFAENQLGKTDDVRSLQAKGVLTKPITGPAEVSEKGGNGSKDEIGIIDSSFYDES